LRALVATAEVELGRVLCSLLAASGWDAICVAAQPDPADAADAGICVVDGAWALRMGKAASQGPILALCTPLELLSLLQARSKIDAYALTSMEADRIAQMALSLLQGAAGNLGACRLVGSIVIDPADGSAYAQGRPVALTRREFALLQLLAEQPGIAVKREVIEDRLYRWGQELGSNAVDVHIHALRRKFWPGLIETLRGVGFRLNLDAQPASATRNVPATA
jgi:DNA-binding response OmpR family regulator